MLELAWQTHHERGHHYLRNNGGRNIELHSATESSHTILVICGVKLMNRLAITVDLQVSKSPYTVS
jgi:hypothetical protein